MIRVYHGMQTDTHRDGKKSISHIRDRFCIMVCESPCSSVAATRGTFGLEGGHSIDHYPNKHGHQWTGERERDIGETERKKEGEEENIFSTTRVLNRFVPRSVIKACFI